MRYRCKKVFSLTQWSGWIHAEFLVFDITQETFRQYLLLVYGAITLYGTPSQKLPLKR